MSDQRECKGLNCNGECQDWDWNPWNEEMRQIHSVTTFQDWFGDLVSDHLPLTDADLEGLIETQDWDSPMGTPSVDFVRDLLDWELEAIE